MFTRIYHQSTVFPQAYHLTSLVSSASPVKSFCQKRIGPLSSLRPLPASGSVVHRDIINLTLFLHLLPCKVKTRKENGCISYQKFYKIMDKILKFGVTLIKAQMATV